MPLRHPFSPPRIPAAEGRRRTPTPRAGALLALMAISAAFLPAGPAAALASDARVIRVAGERHADPALEALLPTVIGGVALTVESQAGTDLSTSSGPFDTFLASLGKSRADFSVASA